MNRLTRSDTRAVSCAVQAARIGNDGNAKPQQPRRGFTPVVSPRDGASTNSTERRYPMKLFDGGILLFIFAHIVLSHIAGGF